MENRALTPINQLVPYINAEKSRFEFAEYADQGEELTVTLWADVARSIASLSIESLSLPIIVVFTSLKVKLYLDKIVLNTIGSSLFFIDLDILEVNSYKSVFSKCTEPLKILPPFTKQAREAQILQTAKVTIADAEIFMPKYDVEDEKLFAVVLFSVLQAMIFYQMSRSFHGTCSMLSLPSCLCWGWKSYRSQWVVQVRLERLEVRNAIGKDTLRVLQNTFEAVSEDSSANVLLISSKVPKMYCAVADLKEFIMDCMDKYRVFVCLVECKKELEE
ncbi:hypothetical protein COP1_028229 [Malus domestica]